MGRRKERGANGERGGRERKRRKTYFRPVRKNETRLLAFFRLRKIF